MTSPPRGPWIVRALARATDRCRETQGKDGEWACAPDPRITETALACIALSQTDSAEDIAAVRRAQAWLRTAVPQDHHPLAELFEGMLRSAALGQNGTVDLRSVGYDHPALGARIRLLESVAALTGQTVWSGRPVADLRSDTERACSLAADSRLKPWSQAELLAVHALLEFRFGEKAKAKAAALVLSRHQSSEGLFHANPISSALALWALAVVGPDSPAWALARRAVLGTQHPDGTWRFCTNDVWDTTLVLRALQHVPSVDKQMIGRAVGFLRSAQNRDGGWPFRSGTESDNDTTSAALLALSGGWSPLPMADPDGSVTRALTYLAQRRTSDGLWRTWQHLQDPPAQDVVAHVATALAAHPDAHTIAVDDARQWLIEQWKGAGRWTAAWYWSLPYATHEAAAALPDESELLRRAAVDLLAQQNGDGGWPAEPGRASRPSATGLALAALARCGVRSAAAWSPGLNYLLDTQKPDGTWPGRPEMVGPRPLLTHYQTQTDAFAVMGLTAALSLSQRRPSWQ